MNAATYEAQIRRMADVARDEMRRRPTFRIDFHFPAGVLLIATVQSAAKAGLLTSNEEGAAVLVLDRMARVCDDVPTVLMVRVAFEIACANARKEASL